MREAVYERLLPAERCGCTARSAARSMRIGR
jgi:hypothetical protein